MEDKRTEDKHLVYLIYEAVQARTERTIRRFIIALVVTTILMFASNIIWLYIWQTYDYESVMTETVVDVDSKSGPANYIGNNGDIYNGQSESEKNDKN